MDDGKPTPPGHPLRMLGPSILFFGPPFSTGHAFHACRRANARVAARVGLVVAICELSALVLLVMVQVYIVMLQS